MENVANFPASSNIRCQKTVVEFTEEEEGGAAACAVLWTQTENLSGETTI